jgi:hypothetical protein
VQHGAWGSHKNLTYLPLAGSRQLFMAQMEWATLLLSRPLTCVPAWGALFTRPTRPGEERLYDGGRDTRTVGRGEQGLGARHDSRRVPWRNSNAVRVRLS